MATSSSKSPNKKKASVKPRSAKPGTREHCEALMERFVSHTPFPRCELYYRTPFQLLASVVLSAQATDKSVNLAMKPVYDQGFTPADAVRLGPAGILKIIRSIGLAPTKSRRLAELAQILLDRHHGEVPATRAELEDLPGVGRKTANVILGELFGQPTLAVDTHVFRVTGRLGLHSEKTPEACEAVLLKKIDERWLPRAHHWFILLGRYTCQARRPQCDRCPVADLCPSCSVGP